MESFITFKLDKWNEHLTRLIDEFDVYVPTDFEDQIEYSLLSGPEQISEIRYNKPKPSTPLKTFFLPVKENVVKLKKSNKIRIILGAPACDLHALSILDEIYLDKDYTDPGYLSHRNNTILIGTDCHTYQEHCHCTSYGFNPWPEKNEDLVFSVLDDQVFIEIRSDKGIEFSKERFKSAEKVKESDIENLLSIRNEIASAIRNKNQSLPDYEKTGRLVSGSDKEIWEKYSDTCVSCGACAAICPTCSCFLFVERPEFEKVRSLDTCQYPGFEKVAAGEDPLRSLPRRFRNRYMCKYVWKPEKFQSKACTGCGRCIEACIGEINKNELFIELNQKEHLSYEFNSSDS